MKPVIQWRDPAAVEPLMSDETARTRFRRVVKAACDSHAGADNVAGFYVVDLIRMSPIAGPYVGDKGLMMAFEVAAGKTAVFAVDADGNPAMLGGGRWGVYAKT